MAGGGSGFENIRSTNQNTMSSNAAPAGMASSSTDAASTQNPLVNAQQVQGGGDTFVPTKPQNQYGSFGSRLAQSNFLDGRMQNPFDSAASAQPNEYGSAQNYMRTAMQMPNGLYGNPYAQQGPMFGMNQAYQNQFQGYMPNQFMQQSQYQNYQPQGMYQNYRQPSMYGGYQNPYGGIAGLMF